jgi:hypothetical protein
MLQRPARLRTFDAHGFGIVMAGLVPAIRVFTLMA